MDQVRENLCVGLTCPPEALDHSEGWERGPLAVGGTKLSDGDDGGVPRGLNGPEPAIGGLFSCAGDVNAGGIEAPYDGAPTRL